MLSADLEEQRRKEEERIANAILKKTTRPTITKNLTGGRSSGRKVQRAQSVMLPPKFKKFDQPSPKNMKTEDELRELEEKRERERIAAEKVDARFKANTTKKPKFWWEQFDDDKPKKKKEKKVEVPVETHVNVETVEETKVEVPVVEETKVEPKVEPKVVKPKIEAPVVEETKIKVPVVEKTKAEAPKVETPVFEKPRETPSVVIQRAEDDEFTSKDTVPTQKSHSERIISTGELETPRVPPEPKKNTDVNNPNEVIFSSMRSIEQFQNGEYEGLETRHLIYVIKVAAREALQLSVEFKDLDQGEIKFARVTETYIRSMLKFLSLLGTNSKKLVKCLQNISTEASGLISANSSPEKYQDNIRKSLMLVVKLNNEHNSAKTKSRKEIAYELIQLIDLNLKDLQVSLEKDSTLRTLLRNVKELSYYKDEHAHLPRVIDFLGNTCRQVMISKKAGNRDCMPVIEKGLLLTASLMKALE